MFISISRLLLLRRFSLRTILSYQSQVNTMTQVSLPHTTELYQWNIVMTESNKRQRPENTLLLFDQLIEKHPEISPNFITYLLVLTACIHLKNINYGKRIHDYIRQNWSTTVDKNETIKVFTCLMQFYASCGDLITGRS